MEVPYSRDFDAQIEQYSFCFTCETCAHFDDEENTCLHGFPNRMHQIGYYRTDPRPETILFCKDFDLP